jgi:hypothetical protein
MDAVRDGQGGAGGGQGIERVGDLHCRSGGNLFNFGGLGMVQFN